MQHLVPGDIVDIVMGDRASNDPVAAARLRERLHLDRWIAPLPVLVGALWLPWLPILRYVPFSESPAANLTHIAIPSLVLSLTVLPLIVRMTRASVLENLRLDYVRTARSKGLGEARVIF